MEKTQPQWNSDFNFRLNRIEKLMLRIGTVTETRPEEKLARVSWDQEYRSALLRVMENGTGWMPEVGNKVVSIHRPNGDGEGFILGAL